MTSLNFFLLKPITSHNKSSLSMRNSLDTALFFQFCELAFLVEVIKKLDRPYDRGPSRLYHVDLFIREEEKRQNRY